MVPVILGVTISYLLGSIPFGYIAGKVVKGIDIRDYGSGNVGATNVLRTLGAKAGIVVLLLDAAKGFVSVLVIGSLAVRLGWPLGLSMVKALCGAAAIIGHDFPIFLGLKGGKGVATGLGVFLAATPLYAWLAINVFVVAVGVTSYVSVGSLLMAATLPVLMVIFRRSEWYLGLSLFWLVSVIYSHRENIRRLLQGKEPRIRRKARSPREHQ
jgi:glycerol-3-phosphate acyltransferase PlsY